MSDPPIESIKPKKLSWVTGKPFGPIRPYQGPKVTPVFDPGAVFDEILDTYSKDDRTTPTHECSWEFYTVRKTEIWFAFRFRFHEKIHFKGLTNDKVIALYYDPIRKSLARWVRRTCSLAIWMFNLEIDEETGEYEREDFGFKWSGNIEGGVKRAIASLTFFFDRVRSDNHYGEWSDGAAIAFRAPGPFEKQASIGTA